MPRAHSALAAGMMGLALAGVSGAASTEEKASKGRSLRELTPEEVERIQPTPKREFSRKLEQGEFEVTGSFESGLSAYEEGEAYEGGKKRNDRKARKKYQEAIQIFWKLANKGNAQAQTKLGSMYANGQAVPQDDRKAMQWYRRAAKQGHPQAQYRLGRMYAIGRGVAKDKAEAEKWYRKAAEQGHAWGQFDLGLMYHQGQGVHQDYTKAVKWYRKAAKQGRASAQHNLAVMYAKGQGLPQNYVKAHMWFNLAAAQGNKQAAKGRKAVAERMTQEQIAEAQEKARKLHQQISTRTGSGPNP